ncbi:MAG: hypothetical protein J5U17_07190 [Candidatus Methanoperedens sp.]|nr:hypothetical protein [Candidatus Methanoperedens sp.]MCE8427494.1 hypothetical protein [Candidatus Methanoperedens sp.]
MRKDNSRKVEQTERFSIDEELHALDKEELFDLLQDILEEKPEIFELILEWFKEKQNTAPEKVTQKTSINDELFMEYWNDAREIISDFNEYGGGSEEDEEEACSHLDRISDLINEGNISTAAKVKFLDDAFEEYNYENSGLEDAMMDVFFEICQTNEEWEYLVKKLDGHPSDWRKKLIMDIQKKYLHDDKAYLDERMKKLHYGMDYWDLAAFYIEKGETDKALETAEKGLLKGEGRLTELFQFLADHFAKKGDTANLERIVHTALEKGDEEKPMLDIIFEYYRAQGNYEKAKGALLKSFEYLRICLDKNMKKNVVEIILSSLSPGSNTGFVLENDFDVFADNLKEEYPERIIQYYMQKAHGKTKGGSRKTYGTAARYLAKVKDIYTDILKDESKWIQSFSAFKAEFKNRPTFLEAVKDLSKIQNPLDLI